MHYIVDTFFFRQYWILSGLGCTIILTGIVWTIMNKINKNNLIYVNIQQSGVIACSSTVKTTTIELYDYPFYALNQLKALQWKVNCNRAFRILPLTTCKTIRHLRIKKGGNMDLMAKAYIGVIIELEQSTSTTYGT